jgi:hypothetical protein
MSTKKELPPIVGMTATDAQWVCWREGPWNLYEHDAAGNHVPIANRNRVVRRYCSDNPRVRGRTYAIATDLALELHPVGVQPSLRLALVANRLRAPRPRRTRTKPKKGPRKAPARRSGKK